MSMQRFRVFVYHAKNSIGYTEVDAKSKAEAKSKVLSRSGANDVFRVEERSIPDLTDYERCTKRRDGFGV